MLVQMNEFLDSVFLLFPSECCDVASFNEAKCVLVYLIPCFKTILCFKIGNKMQFHCIL